MALVCPEENEEKIVTFKQRFDGLEDRLSLDSLGEETPVLLEKIQAAMLAKSHKFHEDNLHEADSYQIFKKILKEHKGFIRVWWNDNVEIEAKIQAETKATSRCQPLSWGKGQGKAFFTGEPASHQWIFAQSY